MFFLLYIKLSVSQNRSANKVDEWSWIKEQLDWIDKSAVSEQDRSNFIKRLIVTNPNTPPHILASMAATEVEAVLERIAENPRTPPATLIELALHPSSDVRSAVVENPCCPLAVMHQLLRDDDVDVRYRIAENPAAGVVLLTKLCEDANPYVSARALRTITKLNGESSLVSMPDRQNTESLQDECAG